MRLIAATVVLLSHSLQAVTSENIRSVDPVARMFSGQMTSGGVAVAIFFVMSGYLITQSWERTRNWKAFLWARALRLYPALFVVVLASVFVLGPLMTTDAGYWSDPRTWAYLSSLALHNAENHQVLSGVFTDHPLAKVNSSLWTLQYEVFCYLGVLAFGLARLLTRESVTLIAVTLVGLMWRVPYIDHMPWVTLPADFAAGAALFFWQDRLVWKNEYALLAALGVLIAGATYHLEVGVATAGAYLVLSVARGGKLSGWGRFGDFSYGLYLLNFPVLQVIVSLGLHSPALLAPAAFAVAVFLSAGLWHFVEAPALRHRSRLPYESRALNPQ